MTDFSIYEVGPRDGLQSADTIMPTASKVEMVERIAQAGITSIEVGAMVNPERVPNMADSATVFKKVQYLRPEVTLGMLVPNKIGIDRAKIVGVDKFNVFFSPSEYFNANNHGKGLATVFSEYCAALNDVGKEDVRVYVSTAFGCPMQGEIHSDDMARALTWADSLGSSIVLADTILTSNHITSAQFRSMDTNVVIKGIGTNAINWITESNQPCQTNVGTLLKRLMTNRIS